MRSWQTHPTEKISLTRAKGCTVWDDRGGAYLDLLAGCWCAVLGHSHPRLVAAVRRQVDTFAHSDSVFPNDRIPEALAKLAEILPPALERVVFLNTGSESVELALKMARAATGGDAVVVVERSFYGDTTYAFALSEIGRTASWLPALGRVIRLPIPRCGKCPVGSTWPCDDFPCLDQLRTLAAERRPRVAAVLFEPVLANAGVVVPPPGYGTRLRGLATSLGALFISEEVTTGVGRTGRWFACERDDVQPDILVMGKALGGGLPVAAVATTRDVENRAAGKMIHTQSHQNDPLSGRIAATVIATLQDEELVERAARMGDRLLGGLRDIQSRRTGIAEVRGAGLMVGVELEPDRARHGITINRRLRDSGFIANYQPQNASFRLFPPYVIQADQIDAFLNAFDEALSSTTE